MASRVSRSATAFLRNVPWTVGKREIAAFCSEFGKVTSVKMDYDKSNGMHRGWAVVEFGTKDGLSSLLSKDKHFLEGNWVFAQKSINNK